MDKWKRGTLRSSSGRKVKNQKQAVAIMLSEQRNEAKHGGRYKEGRRSRKRQNHRRQRRR